LRWKQPNQSNPTTWRLAAMNMAIRGIDFNCGKEPANSFTQDQQPDLRADYVMVDSVNHTHFFELKICENLNFPIRYT
jgi:type I restriction-modification system DNA methylase subunit